MTKNLEEKMDLNQTLCYLTNELIKQLPFENQKTLQDCFKMIEQDIQLLQQYEIPPEEFIKRDNTKNIELANNSLLTLVKQLTTGSLSSETIKFIVSMSQFIFNWNQNVTKLETIDLLTKLIYQHIAAIEKINNTISTLQKTINTYQNLRNWMPPAYDIAKVYCDELFKENDK
jgi:hypothetical protein